MAVIDENEVIACNLCGGHDVKELQVIDSYSIVECSHCHLRYLNPQFDESVIDDTYGGEYYKKSWEKDVTEIIARLKDLNRLKEPGKLIDVGCGSGRFLYLAREQGWDVEGCDLSPSAVRAIKERLDIKSEVGALEGINFQNDHYDVITFWHVIEHLPDPLRTLKKAYGLLKKDGFIFIATPNEDFIALTTNPKRKKNVMRSIVRDEGHVYFFNARTLKKMMEKAGFEVMEVTVDFNKGKPTWEHHFKYFMYRHAARVGLHLSKAILLIGKKK